MKKLVFTMLMAGFFTMATVAIVPADTHPPVAARVIMEQGDKKKGDKKKDPPGPVVVKEKVPPKDKDPKKGNKPGN